MISPIFLYLVEHVVPPMLSEGLGWSSGGEGAMSCSDATQMCSLAFVRPSESDVHVEVAGEVTNASP